VVNDWLPSLPTLSPAELNDLAALDERVDRKYVVDPATLAATIEQALSGSAIRVLAVDGDTSFGYESTYFDTADDHCFRQAAAGRRRRFKVRRRLAEGRADEMLEVKLRTDRGATAKHRMVAQGTSTLSAAETAFVDSITAPLGGDVAASMLQPAVATGYRRTTLLIGDGESSSRVTIDRQLRWRQPGHTWMPMLADDVDVVETKSAHGPTVLDRALWQRGVRPQRLSKFAVASVLAEVTLPSNRWHRVINTYCR
jgi:hypothetical protein